MKHRLLTIGLSSVLALLLATSVSAQTLPAGSILTSAESKPYTMPPTPEAATFMSHGNYSVSRASGTADVTIPIYEIKTAELTFPINLTYQGGGIKVTDKAGWVGLGWTLSASGVVNHTVLGLPDKGVYSELPTASEIRERNDATPLNCTVANTNGGLNGIDKMRDKYIYSFGSTGGSFYIISYESYLQVPYSENRIRRLLNQTGKLTAGFVITDDNGVSYWFEQPENSTMLSTTYNHTRLNMQALSESYTYDSAWYLTKIVSANKTDSIRFVYSTVADSYIDRTLSHNYAVKTKSGAPSQDKEFSSVICTRKVNRSPVLKEIVFSQGRLEFSSSTGRKDGRRYGLSEIKLKNNNGETLRTVTFSYGNFAGNRLKLDKVVFKGAEGTVYDSYDFSYYNVDTPICDSASMSEFGYLNIGETDSFFSQDQMGYYNGAPNRSLLGCLPDDEYHDKYLANRRHSAKYAKTHSLKSVSCLTGTNTEFVYDDENYSKPRTPGIRVKKIVSKDVVTGRTIVKIYEYKGAKNHIVPNDVNIFADYSISHIKDVSKFAPSYEVTSVKSFSSEPLVPEYGSSAAVLYREITEKAVDLSSSSDTLKTVYGYEVTEPEFVRTDIYQESYYRVNVDEYQRWNEKVTELIPKEILSPFLIYGFTDSSYLVPGYVVDNSWKNGFLNRLEEYEWKGKNYALKKKIVNNYQLFGCKDRISIGLYVKGILPRYEGQKYTGDFYYANFDSILDFYFFDLEVSTGWKKLVSTITSEYDGSVPKETVESYSYGSIDKTSNSHSYCTLYSRAVKNAPSVYRDVRFYKYVDDTSILPQNVKDEMLERNLRSEAVEEQYARLSGAFGPTLFKNNRYIIDKGNVCRDKVELYYSGSNSPQWTESWQITDFDSRGRPQCVLNTDGTQTVYLWRPEEIYPSAVIQNASLSQVPEGALDMSEDELRASLPGAFVTCFEFEPLIGMKSSSEPDGLVNKYGYDDCSRLKDVSTCQNGQDVILKEYSYSLGRNNNSCRTTEWIDYGKPMSTTDFYDSFGYLSQSVRHGFSPDGRDVAIDYASDIAGRVTRRSQPFPCSSDGKKVGNVLPSVRGYYNDMSPFCDYVYEKSAGGRMMSDSGPGQMWKSQGRSKKISYHLNEADGLYSCVLWKMSNQNITDDKFQSAGLCPAGYLNVVERSDEDGIKVIEFVDPAGHKVLERRVNGKEYLDTYSIYDLRGNLRVVLPPMASKSLEGTLSAEQKEDVVDKYAYLYGYDPLDRNIRKKFPGQEWEYRTYDKAGHCIFVQDGELRKVGKWRFSIPDRHGRTAMTGLCSNAGEDLSSMYVYADVSSLAEIGYVIENLSLVAPEYHTVNYYDSYSCLQTGSLKQYSSVLSPHVANVGKTAFRREVFGMDVSVQGQQTARRVFNLGEDGENIEVFFYNELNQQIGTVRYHTKESIVEEMFASLTLGGKPVSVLREHLRNDETAFSERQEFRYDSAGRLSEVQHAMDGAQRVSILKNIYDEVGRLKKTVYGSGVDSLSYSYNVRNLPTEIRGTDFRQSLYYNMSPGTPRHNGFVSAVSWRIGNSVDQGYFYGYDDVGRLVSAQYGEGPSLSENKGRFDEMFSQYDLNGNLLHLQRSGQTGEGVYEMVDDLTLSYDGNRLASVSDAVRPRHVNRACNRFNPRASAEIQYAYDSCGNMVEDNNRSLAVSYNSLSLPDSISFYGNERTIAYGWRGDGTKRFKSVDDRGTLSLTEYFDGVVYRDSAPDMLLTASGYYSLHDHKYRYFIRDYLGSVRLVRNGDGDVEEVNSYYPSGALLVNPIPDTQPYKYSGKERVGELGLGWYDFGARHYNPVLFCWHSADALSETNAGTSPYSFCLNNPVNYVDPDGNWVETAWDLFNIGLGVKSFVQNVKAGNYWSAAADAGGVVVDVAAAVLPLVPGGVGALRAGMKAADAAHDAVDAVRAADKAGDALKTVARADDAVDAAKVVRKGPDANKGVAKPHGAVDHNDIIDAKVKELLSTKGVTGIRKNQVQVDAKGNRVGNNRPDLQWDKDGVHYTFEVDRNMRNSNRHRDVITGQDPQAEFEFELIKKEKQFFYHIKSH